MSIASYLVEQGLCDAPVTLTRIGDGHSNITQLAQGGDKRVVVRQPPPPPIPPGGHDVVREARIQRALVESRVPVPRILAIDETAPLYVMEALDGVVATTTTPPALDSSEQRRAVGEQLIDVLAELHAIDRDAVGLADFGRPSIDVERHLRRFATIAEPLGDELAELLAWLIDDPPAAQTATLIHGDYRLGNVMLAPGPQVRIQAVLDWELASVGDPLRDVGYFLATYAVTGEPLHALTEMSTAALAPGYPSRAELADRYAARTGRDLADIQWYMTMALWKLAVLFEYQRRRVADGIGDPYYARDGLVEGFLTAARGVRA